jgi:hypothetical protein
MANVDENYCARLRQPRPAHVELYPIREHAARPPPPDRMAGQHCQSRRADRFSALAKTNFPAAGPTRRMEAGRIGKSSGGIAPNLGRSKAFLQEQNICIQPADFLGHQPKSRLIGSIPLPGIQRYYDERFMRKFSWHRLSQTLLAGGISGIGVTTGLPAKKASIFAATSLCLVS